MELATVTSVQILQFLRYSEDGSDWSTGLELQSISCCS